MINAKEILDAWIERDKLIKDHIEAMITGISYKMIKETENFYYMQTEIVPLSEIVKLYPSNKECECGSFKTTGALRGKSHSNWCPKYE